MLQKEQVKNEFFDYFDELSIWILVSCITRSKTGITCFEKTFGKTFTRTTTVEHEKTNESQSNK